MILRNTILYLIGFAGTGKYTIAQEIIAQTGAVLIDNHLILNPLFTIIQPDGKTPIDEGVWEQATKIREAVLITIEQYAPPERSFIFTNELTEQPEDQATYRRIETTAAMRKSTFIPVRLTCALPELERRVVAVGRSERFKDTNLNNCREKFTSYTVLKPNHPNLIDLDVSALSAKEAAAEILRKAVIL